MRTVDLSFLSRPVSALALGTMHFREETIDLARKVLDGWAEAGGTLLDCAKDYGDGSAERAVGRWMRERGNRRDIVLLTKGAHPDGSGPRVHPGAIEQDLLESMDRLGADEIEIYLLHRDDETVPVGEIVDVLDHHYRTGRVLSVGVSNWTCERIEAANDYAAANGRVRFTVSSAHLSLARQSRPPWPGCVSAAGAGDRAYYATRDIVVIPWSPLAGGFFAAPDDLAPHVASVYDTAENRERLRRARHLATRLGVTASQVALAWVLNQPLRVIPVIGALATREIKESVAALDVCLTADELAWLDLESDLMAASKESA